MHLRCPAFADGEEIPRLHTGEGRDLSPPLQWDDVPSATAAFALVMDDPDAPAGTWVHWVLYGLPAGCRSLPEGLPRSATLPGGARQGRCWGVERFERVGYHGPLPPRGPAHHYRFRLAALDTPLDLPPEATIFELGRAMAGHVLAEATLVGLYARRS